MHGPKLWLSDRKTKHKITLTVLEDNKGYYQTKTKTTLQVFAHNTLYLPLLCTAASPQVTVGGGQRLQEGTEGLELGGRRDWM